MYKRIGLFLAFTLTVSGCQNTVTPITGNMTSSNSAKSSQKATTKTLQGKVEFPSGFKTKAGINDIITNSAVSLVYPENYQELSLRSKPIATSLTDNNGNFSISAPDFDPIVGQIFILEATKRVNATSGDSITLRTFVQWSGVYFKSITKNGIYINSATTSLTIMAGANTITPENTIEKLDVVNGATQISNISGTSITSAMVTYVKDLVDTSLNNNYDPINTIYYQQQKFLSKNISLANINKLSGCISQSGGCTGTSPLNIPIITSLPTSTNQNYSFRTEDIKVNTTTLYNQSDSAISVNNSGAKVVTWVSTTDGSYRGIYAQRYASNGDKVGNEFRVNSDITPDQFNEYGCKNVALNNDGTFMVIWTQWDANSLGIFGQKFNADGSPNGLYFRVNDYETDEQRYPSIATDRNGNYIVTWSSHNQDGSSWGIYAKKYYSNGSSSNETLVNTVTNGTQYVSNVALSTTGKAVITWALQDNLWEIYAQKFNTDFTKDGSEFKVNTGRMGGNPDVAIDSNNNFTIVWHSFNSSGEYDYDVMARRYTDTGPVGTEEFQVNDLMKISDQGNAKITMNQNGQSVITWHDISGNDGSGNGAHARKYNADGSPNGDEFIVNKYRRKNQMYPIAGIAGDGKYSIVWHSDIQDGSGYGTYMQNFVFSDSVAYSPITGNQIGVDACATEGGICLKGEQQINSYVLGNQMEVSTATNKSNGDHVAVWTSEGQDGSGYSMYAQMYYANGQKKGREIQVNSTDYGTQANSWGSKSVGMDNNGNWVVTWITTDKGYNEIKCQRFNSSGEKVGNETLVSENTNTTTYPSISVDSTGKFVITWNVSNGSNWDVYVKKYNANGVQTSSQILVNDVTSNDHLNPYPYLNDDGTYIVAWTDGREGVGKYDAYAQKFNSDNTKDGANFKINPTSTANESGGETIIKDSTGRYIFTYHKHFSTGYDVYARTLSPSGILGTEFVVANGSGEEGNPKIALLNNDKFVITWNDMSNSDNSGIKIKAKIFNSDTTVFNVSNNSEINVNSFVGNNNYYSLGHNQAFPNIDSDGTGAFNIVWTSEGQDGSGKSVHIKRYYPNGTVK